MKCSRPTCPGTASTAGLCSTHYRAWQLSNPVVPQQIVAEHIKALRDAGMNGVRISEMAGVSFSSVYRISSGRNINVVRSGVARKILAVKTPDVLHGRADSRVPIVGTARRLQALTAMGYTTEELSELTGYAKRTLPRLIHARKANVTVATAETVDAVYRSLMFLPAPDTTKARRARLRAQRAGWVPPLAWDDIDDPNETPDLGRPVDTAEAVIDLRDDGLTDQEIAKVLNLKVDSVQQSARRYERKLAS